MQFQLKILLVIFFIINVQFSFAQKKIYGKVTDNDGSSLPGVTVLIKGTSRGTVTDIDGIYSISASENEILVFQFVGLVSEEKKVSSSSVLNTVLYKRGARKKPNNNSNRQTNISVEKPKRQSFFGAYHMEVIYSFQHSNFYALKFNEQLESGTVEHGYGDSYTFRQSKYPFIIDITGFISRYSSSVSENKT